MKPANTTTIASSDSTQHSKVNLKHILYVHVHVRIIYYTLHNRSQTAAKLSLTRLVCWLIIIYYDMQQYSYYLFNYYVAGKKRKDVELVVGVFLVIVGFASSVRTILSLEEKKQCHVQRQCTQFCTKKCINHLYTYTAASTNITEATLCPQSAISLMDTTVTLPPSV